METPPIFLLVGCPAVGKTTLAGAILRRFPSGLHIPVDDLREWVVSGFHGPLDWTDETTRQFALAEEAACDLAIRYQDSGFAVVIDHCRSLAAMDPLIERRLQDRNVHKVLVTASLATNLLRNATRTNKDFEADLLTETIQNLHSNFARGSETYTSWTVFDNDVDGVEAAVDRLFAQLEVKP